MIYHYTDIHGLMGILNEEALWATRIDFLNDYEEFTSGLNMVKKHLFNLEEKESSVNKKLLLKVFRTSLSDNLASSLYTTSFSGSKDSLYHWMSYCPNNAGYCIGLEHDEISTVENLKYPFYDFVSYDDEKIKNTVVNIITKNLIDDSFKNMEMNCIEVSVQSAFFKKKEFKGENEARMVLFSNPEKIMYRKTGSGLIIPYMKNKISLDVIKEIWIGPNSNTSLARKGLESFLESKNMSKDLIKESSCSLRVV